MNTDCFNRLCYLLRNLGGLRDTRHLYKRLLITPSPVPADSNDYRWKYFKGCLGALDGTYIPVRVPQQDIPRYRNRKGTVSVNVLAVCDHNMNFVFVLSSWEGSAADSRILRDAITRPNGLRVPNDPLEDEVPELFDDGEQIDGVDENDGFIDQVESSHAWTTGRDNMATEMFANYLIIGYTMEGSTDAIRGGRERKRVGATTRMVWSYAEECELMLSLNDLVLRGHKCDNGFRSDACLGISGVGLNSTTFHVDALPEVWEAQIKVDGFTKSLMNKAFPFYSQWVEIFGNDRANGQDSQLYADTVNEMSQSGRNKKYCEMEVDDNGESNPAAGNYTTDKTSFSIDETSAAPVGKGKGTKRKQADVVDGQFMDTIGSYLVGSKETFGQIAQTMGHIAQRMGSEFDNRQRREQVYNNLSEIDFISVEARVAIAKYLCNNTKDMDMFFGLLDEAKTVFVTNIMRKLTSL
ncbi:hypothetical protein ACS0TY_012975 [Phlomoides rotata]